MNRPDRAAGPGGPGCAGLLLALLLSGATLAAPLPAAPLPGSPADDWRTAAVGTAEIVLPGFGPLHVTGQRIDLSAGRAYEWGTRLLPDRIAAAGELLAGPMDLVLRESGQAPSLTLGTLRITQAGEHHVELVTTGAVGDLLAVEARIRVEYDGLATVELLLTPRRPFRLEGLELVVPVVRTPELRLQAFEPATISDYRKQVVFPVCGALAYHSVLGFGDGDRSFWLLTDEPAVPASASTRLECTATSVRMRQPLLGTVQLDAPLRLQFAFMATPVRDLPGAWRKDRVAAGLSAAEAGLGNRQLWWVEALPHYALPYLAYPPGVRERLDPAERAAWPGVEGNRRSVEAWRRLGIERLPYMSLRAPSALDPVTTANLPAWKVLPAVTMPAVGDGPYQQGLARPLLSHRAAGFSDYLVYQLDQVLAGLPARGFYFDQAAPIGSANPAHLPADARVRPAMASDILATRAFFKRLATAIYQRGREPLIYVHNSTATVLPAYSFVTAMVQGEEFNSTLQDLNYQQSIDLETLQATYLGGQFGVPIIWLEEVWSDYLAKQRPWRYRSDQAAWLKSPEFDTAWRNFMSLALVHDIPVWTLAPEASRQRVFGALDRFGVSASRFIGYWKLDPAWRSRAVLVSLYLRPDGRTLAVIVNRGRTERVLTRDDLAPFLGGAAAPEAARRALGESRSSPVGKRLPPGDFLLATLAGG